MGFDEFLFDLRFEQETSETSFPFLSSFVPHPKAHVRSIRRAEAASFDQFSSPQAWRKHLDDRWGYLLQEPLVRFVRAGVLDGKS